jgi:MgtC family
MLAVSAEIAQAAAARPLDGQGWRQAGELAVALVLSASIGLEREIRQKNAGLRTHTLVGVGAALFMLISTYGFTDVLLLPGGARLPCRGPAAAPVGHRDLGCAGPLPGRPRDPARDTR